MLGGRVEQKIVEDYRSIGYEMSVATLCAADYYTPQKRERVIFIGNRIGLKNYHPLPILSPEQYITTGQSIGDLMDYPEDPHSIMSRQSTVQICKGECLNVQKEKVYIRAILMHGKNALGMRHLVRSRRIMVG